MILAALLGLTGCGVSDRSRSPSCLACHPDEVRRWAGSHHALAERPLRPDEAWAREVGAVRIIGVEPLRQALVPVDGRLQVYDPAWDVARGAPFSIFDDPRTPGDWGHWLGGGMTWNGRCGSCHTTGFEKGLRADGSYRSRFERPGVGCSACHGDANAHAAGGPPPHNDRMEHTCRMCHSLRSTLDDRFRPGDAFLDHAVPVAPVRPLFREDGRGLGEVFESNFWGSAMHAAGVGCGACHDPHDGRLLAAGDALCRRCHGGLPASHPEHPPLPCVECHMPTTRVMGIHERRDHGFTIPRRGLEPDPCASCHPDRPATAAPDPLLWALATGEALDPEELPSHRRAAYVALLAQRPDGLPLAREALHDADPEVRLAALEALPLIDREAQRQVARLAGGDPVRAVRAVAQRRLALLGLRLEELPVYRAWLDHQADHPGPLSERGWLRVRDGDRGGLDDLRRAVDLDPRSAELYRRLARGLLEVGRRAEAEEVLRRVEVYLTDETGISR